MATHAEIQAALANEARKQEVRLRISNLKGTLDTTASLINRLSSINGDNSIMLTQLQTQLLALEEGSGPGLTEEFGSKSTVTRLLEEEREAAKEASIDFVKANPTCSEIDTADAWDAAALAAHPTLPVVLQPGLAFGLLYRVNLRGLGIIEDDTWEAQRAWILATSKDLIMKS